MEAVYSLGRATVNDVRRRLRQAPSYSAVRTMLGRLEEKGLLRHEQEGPRYVYVPTTARRLVQETALRRMLTSLFQGSTERAVAALLEVSAGKLSEGELERIAEKVEAMKGRGK